MKNDSQAMAVIEAILFAAGDPVSINSLMKITELSEVEIIDLCENLSEKYLNKTWSMLDIEEKYCTTSKYKIFSKTFDQTFAALPRRI